MRPPKYEKFPLFGKESPPPQGRTVWPISTVVESLYTPNYPALVLQTWSDSLQRLRSYCWETERRSVRPNCSVYPVGKKLHWIEIWFTLFDGLDVLYHRAKFGDDHTTGAGVVFYVCFFCHAIYDAGALFVRGVYFEQALYRCLWVDFNAFFQFFFRMDCSFRWAR